MAHHTGATTMRTVPPTPRIVALLVVLTLGATACGSTVNQLPGQATGAPGTVDEGLQPADGLAAGDAGGVAPGTGDPAAAPGGAPVVGAPAAAAPGAAAGGGSASRPGRAPAAGAGLGRPKGEGPGGNAAGPGRTAPGVTDKEIVLGVVYPEDSAAAGDSLGLEGVTRGNEERYHDVIAKHINDTGGIAGRKLRLSKRGYSAASDIRTREQAMCSQFTEDDRAFAVAYAGEDTFRACAQKAGLVTISTTFSTSDEQDFAQNPRHFETSTMDLTRQMRNLPVGLVRQNYFDPGYKLGVVTFDDPSFDRAVEGTLRPTLARHGKKIRAVHKISSDQRYTDFSGMGTEAQAAILRFKSEGITHVIFVEYNGLLGLLFMNAAENQDYRPRYGLSSQSGGMAIAPSVPPRQLERAVGIGWVAQLDVSPKDTPPSRARDRCLAVYERAGEVPADATNATVMVAVCEAYTFLKASIERGLPDITPDSFVAGAESLGTTLPALTGLGQQLFRRGRHTGEMNYRLLAWNSKRQTFEYTSRNIKDP